MAWITENIGTIAVLAVLLAAVALVIRSMVKAKKQGRSSCGCDCGSCGCSSCKAGFPKDIKIVKPH